MHVAVIKAAMASLSCFCAWITFVAKAIAVLSRLDRKQYVDVRRLVATFLIRLEHSAAIPRFTSLDPLTRRSRDQIRASIPSELSICPTSSVVLHFVITPATGSRLRNRFCQLAQIEPLA